MEHSNDIVEVQALRAAAFLRARARWMSEAKHQTHRPTTRQRMQIEYIREEVSNARKAFGALRWDAALILSHSATAVNSATVEKMLALLEAKQQAAQSWNKEAAARSRNVSANIASSRGARGKAK